MFAISHWRAEMPLEIKSIFVSKAQTTEWTEALPQDALEHHYFILFMRHIEIFATDYSKWVPYVYVHKKKYSRSSGETKKLLLGWSLDWTKSCFVSDGTLSVCCKMSSNHTMKPLLRCCEQLNYFRANIANKMSPVCPHSRGHFSSFYILKSTESKKKHLSRSFMSMPQQFWGTFIKFLFIYTHLHLLLGGSVNNSSDERFFLKS